MRRLLPGILLLALIDERGRMQRQHHYPDDPDDPDDADRRRT